MSLPGSNVRLLDAKSSNYRAIIGPSTSENALFCGEDVTTKIAQGKLTQSSYCPEHQARFTQRADTRADRRWTRRILHQPSSHDGRRHRSARARQSGAPHISHTQEAMTEGHTIAAIVW